MTRHFGLFQFKEGITEEQIEECFAEMRAMVGIIDHLSPEQVSDLFTYIRILR